MNTGKCSLDPAQLLDESATHAIELRYGALAALLLLVAIRPQRRRVLPAHRIAAHSGAPNCRF